MPVASSRLRAFQHSHTHTRRKARLSSYAPIAVLMGVSLAAALAIAVGFGGAVGMSMHAFMGFLLCSFAMLRLVDLPRFADGFAMYDLLARRWRGYGYVYPFLELGLGLAYFAFIAPVAVYFATAILFAFAGLGVISAFDRGLDIDNPRMETRLGVPLTTLTAVESGVLAVMALVLLWM